MLSRAFRQLPARDTSFRKVQSGPCAGPVGCDGHSPADQTERIFLTRDRGPRGKAMKFFRKSAFSTTTCLATAAIIAFGTASAAQAQDAAAAAPADSAECADTDANGVCDADEKKGDIVVTGSRIARPNLTSAVPIASIGGEEFTTQGETNVGEEQSAAAAEHLFAAEPWPRHRYRRPEPTRSSRPRHVAYPGSG